MESKNPELKREYLKLVGEEPTSVMPDEMEKLIREPSRDSEIVALFKRISDECMIARPDNSTDWERRNRTSSSARPLHAARAASR